MFDPQVNLSTRRCSQKCYCSRRFFPNKKTKTLKGADLSNGLGDLGKLLRTNLSVSSLVRLTDVYTFVSFPVLADRTCRLLLEEAKACNYKRITSDAPSCDGDACLCVANKVAPNGLYELYTTTLETWLAEGMSLLPEYPLTEKLVFNERQLHCKCPSSKGDLYMERRRHVNLQAYFVIAGYTTFLVSMEDSEKPRSLRAAPGQLVITGAPRLLKMQTGYVMQGREEGMEHCVYSLRQRCA